MGFSVDGIVSGLETESIISQLLAIEKQPILNLQKKEADYQVQLTTYGSLKGLLSSVKSAAQGLDAVSDLTGFSASSGDIEKFTVSASSSATAGTHDVTVEQLARAHMVKSTAIFAETEEVVTFTIGATNNTINFKEIGGTGTENELTATLGSDTYTISELMTEIKEELDAAANAVATYTVTYDNSTEKFTISGSGNDVTDINFLWNDGSDKATSAGALLGFNNAANDAGGLTYTSDTKMGQDFTIIAGINDTIDFKEDAVVRAATIAPGTYTIEDLETAVESALDAPGSATYSASYSASTQKFTLSGSGGSVGEIQFLWGTGGNVAKSAASLLGFDAADDTGALTYTSDNELYWSILHIEIGSTFTIDTTNNKIDFYENATSEETHAAEIASGTYTVAGLAAAVESALETASATGDNNIEYTVSYDNSTEKFTIEEKGSNLTAFKLLWREGANVLNSAAATLGFSPVADDEALLSYTGDSKVGDVVHVSISASDDIEDVADAINDADAGVKAAAIFNGTGYQFTLRGEDSGAANVIGLTVTDTDGSNTDTAGLSRLYFDDTDCLVETQAAQDSLIHVDGVEDISRSTNTITDVITGVTITLVETHDDPANDKNTLTVTRNTATVVSKINSFVSAYNKVLDFFETYQGYDAKTKLAGLLQGDGTTNQIRDRLRRLINQKVLGVTAFSRLSDFGVALNIAGGHLEFNAATLNSALSDNFDDALQFFTQTTAGSEGFGVRMVDAMEGFLDSYDGILTARTTGIRARIDKIEDKTERLKIRVQASGIRLKARFDALEVLLGQFQMISGVVTQQLASLKNLNAFISKR